MFSLDQDTAFHRSFFAILKNPKPKKLWRTLRVRHSFLGFGYPLRQPTKIVKVNPKSKPIT